MCRQRWWVVFLALVGCGSRTPSPSQVAPVSIEVADPLLPSSTSSERRRDATTVPRSKLKCDASPADALELGVRLFEQLSIVLRGHPDAAPSLMALNPMEHFEVRFSDGDPAKMSGTITVRGDEGPLATLELGFGAVTPARTETGSRRSTIGPLRIDVMEVVPRVATRSLAKVVDLSVAMSKFRFEAACPS